MGEELWKPIIDYEDRYEISSLGRVRSVDHFDRRGCFHKGRLLKIHLAATGYPVVGLKKNGKQKTRTMHSLMLEHFVGPRPEGMHIRHLDGTRDNYSLSNLVYGTRSENQQDMAKHGRAGKAQAAKTYCPQGHPYDEENTRIVHRKPRKGRGPSVERQCKECQRNHWGKNPKS